MTDHTVDDWDSYARLVLNELERHNDLLLKINEKLDSIKLQQALYEQEINQVKSDVSVHTSDIKDIKKRVYKLEQGELIEATLARYRKLVISGAVLAVTSIVIPAASILSRIFWSN